jgi:hypothetical protein
MLVVAVISAIVLAIMIAIVVLRALDYLQQHPELVTNGEPLAYQRCQITLAQVIARFKEIKPQITPDMIITWHAPNGHRYTVSFRGIEERRDSASSVPAMSLTWDNIGGVGVRMQPGFTITDANRDGWPDSQYTTGYSFHLLIVPFSGSTINIHIPTNDRPDAVDFAAHTIALAEQMDKRINVFGFDKPPAPHRQRVSRI